MNNVGLLYYVEIHS